MAYTSYTLVINGVYWGYDPLTNLLLTSWDILVQAQEAEAWAPNGMTTASITEIVNVLHILMLMTGQPGPP